MLHLQVNGLVNGIVSGGTHQLEVVGGASVDDKQLSDLQLQLDESHGQQIVELKQQLQVRIYDSSFHKNA